MTTLERAASRRSRSASDLAWMLISRREYGLAILLAVIFVAVTLRSPDFLAMGNLSEILVNGSQIAVIACGVMLVIITNEIDISVGALLGFLTAILGTLVVSSDPTVAPIPGWGWPMWAGIFATLAIGTAIGLLNGLLVTLVRIPSIITTLAMLMILRSLTSMIMHRGNLSPLPPSLRFFGVGTFLGIAMPIWIMALVVLATFLMLRYTPMGRRIFAVGSNARAAALSGLSVTCVKIFAFALTGLLVGVATIITTLATFDAGIGNGVELLVVTCIVVGGVSISGGTGTVLGVFLGVLLLTIQKKVLIFLKLSQPWSVWDKAIQGGLILAAVLIDHLASRRLKKRGH
jgi:rhamnose transport system permease protein